jgi:cellulose synthase/poly-beta-1,6-N-acetylglucosamine synthase-like glycosyltransferase
MELATIILDIGVFFISTLFLGGLVTLLLVIKYGSRTTKVAKKMDYLPNVSIVIPTMNEEKIIEKRLNNILELDYPHEKLEVIFIDNSSKDDTYTILMNYKNKYNIFKPIKQERPGFNNALNQGYSTATGEIVVKSDVTAFTRPDALKNLVANFNDKSVGAVTGIHVFEEKNESLEKEFKDIMYRIQKVESFFHSSLISHGSFGGYRKKIIPKLGEEITADDSEMVVGAVRNGYRAILDPTIQAFEQEPESYSIRIEQKTRRAAGVIKVILSNADMFFNRKYSYFGLLTLPLDFFILIYTPVVTFILLILSIIYIALINSFYYYVGYSILIVLAGLAIIFSVKIRAVFDTLLSCFLGLFKAFTKKKTWK